MSHQCQFPFCVIGFPDAGNLHESFAADLQDQFFMSCNFQTLYFSEEGFIARCGSCGNFHVAFMSAMFIMQEADYENLCRITQYKMQEADFTFSENSKSVMIPTSSKSAFIMLTRKELFVFAAMLEAADSEYKALTMIGLFNKGNQNDPVNE